MKATKVAVVTTLILSLTALIFLVHAGSWSALSSGYAVTTNYQGVEVPIGTPVTATAGTTNAELGLNGHVVFLWHDPDDNVVYTSPNISMWQNGSKYYDKNLGQNLTIYYANDTRSVSTVGDWGIQALFYDTWGNLKGQSGLTKIRATSFYATPEFPIGTLAVMLAFFGALAIYAIGWKKKNSAGTGTLT